MLPGKDRLPYLYGQEEGQKGEGYCNRLDVPELRPRTRANAHVRVRIRSFVCEDLVRSASKELQCSYLIFGEPLYLLQNQLELIHRGVSGFNAEHRAKLGRNNIKTAS